MKWRYFYLACANCLVIPLFFAARYKLVMFLFGYFGMGKMISILDYTVRRMRSCIKIDGETSTASVIAAVVHAKHDVK